MGLAGFLVLCFAAAALGGWLTAESVDTWYRALEKPVWTPPSWLFGPVWTALYAAMGVAAWRVWRTADARRKPAVSLFVAQLALNVAWSGLFFGLREPGLALIEIVALLALIVWTTWAFERVDRAAAGLMVPYLLWVVYAFTLNAGLWWLN